MWNKELCELFLSIENITVDKRDYEFSYIEYGHLFKGRSRLLAMPIAKILLENMVTH